MIIQLTIGNFLSFKEQSTLSLAASALKEIQVPIEASLDNLKYDKALDWTNYPLGVVWAFIEKGYPVDYGFDMLLFGNIPNGSGLSSSASVEVVTGVALRDLFGYDDIP